MLRVRASSSQFLKQGAKPRLPLAASLTLGAALALAGCSADVARLDGPGPRLAGAGPIPSESIGGRRNAGAPSVYDNSGWGNSGPRVAAVQPAPSGQYDRVASLPDASAPINPSHPFDAPKRTQPVTAAPSPRSGAVPVSAGATIDVQPGDSLYSIAKKHNVSVAALMDLNGLKTPSLKPGQQLRLPSNARRPIARTETAAAPVVTTLPPKASVSTPAPAGTVAETVGGYVVKSGDTLYGIAHTHNTTTVELQRLNANVDARKMKPGMTLKIPGGGSNSVAAATQSAPLAAPVVTSTAPVGAANVRIMNPPPSAVAPVVEASAVAPAKVAGLGPVAVPSSGGTAAVVGNGKFLWPARGTTLAGFGKRPDGAHNDGINIAVAAGSDIKAADAGTVAYAGSEIKAYGNLILLRHEGGWVTAYAHADQILVKRGDTIQRGQVIAKAGATGSVDQPQVHFELRQGSKPIDPAPHMER